MSTTTAHRDPVRIEQAIECLRHARRLLRKAGCKRAAQRVRGALKSAEGAHRHATCHETRSAAFAAHLGLDEPYATEARQLLARAGAT
jgi:hypothetical protein